MFLHNSITFFTSLHHITSHPNRWNFAVKPSVSHEYTYFDCFLMALVQIPYTLHPKLEKNKLISKIGNVRCFPTTLDKHKITLQYKQFN
jgi:hypothetical protein